ncbi:hypothetical protein EMCG_03466 [[Emmonsia] crescens]|uniref:Uncharacterized protein n=1 Tax=[Emmonsia] crescens TaxID=73230 RepID=A0A0G2HW66_9EURO|nr:hypothetical protein EMCG_03466 [Emmonsia crescens UAMH 3008]
MERGRTDILNAVIRNIMILALQDRGKISESDLVSMTKPYLNHVISFSNCFSIGVGVSYGDHSNLNPYNSGYLFSIVGLGNLSTSSKAKNEPVHNTSYINGAKYETGERGQVRTKKPSSFKKTGAHPSRSIGVHQPLQGRRTLQDELRSYDLFVALLEE